MFWKRYLKILFNDNKKEQPIKEAPKKLVVPEEQPEEQLDVVEEEIFEEEEQEIIKVEDIPVTPTKVVNKPKIPVIIDDRYKLKEQSMAEIFLVVIDTNGRPEAKNFQPGIQNFYFIHANDENEAKNIVLSTFRSRPHLVAQLQFAVKATRLTSVIKTVGQGSNFWTYVPFGHQRQPGQQALPPNPDKLLRPDQYGQPSAQNYTAPAPVGGEQITEEDLRGVQFDAADAKVINKLRNPTGAPIAPLPEEAPPATPEQQDTINKLLAQNQAMMEQMKKMTDQMAAAQAQPTRSRRVAAKPAGSDAQPPAQ